ncbi:hypothetical protein [Mycetocola saprophilus]|uniref:hypothetical protein n=1 Tax=Mycetocola saprophilus TaxID=76636 RepID=UPI0004C19E31|nr:hypothetical protein [Mycetocola saprophilus]
MAIYSGRITDPALSALANLSPALYFRLDRPSYGLSGGKMLTTRPVKADLKADGSFTVELVSMEEIAGQAKYIASVTWLDEAGNYQAQDLFSFFAQQGGGDITDGANGEGWSPAHVFWQAERPDPWPAGWIWVDSTTGDVNRRNG